MNSPLAGPLPDRAAWGDREKPHGFQSFAHLKAVRHGPGRIVKDVQNGYRSGFGRSGWMLALCAHNGVKGP